MDFVTGLPNTSRGHDSIWVIVDRLTNSAHFIPINITYPVSRLAEIYTSVIVKLHGIPLCIVSDRDLGFKSDFWKKIVRETTENVKLIREKMKTSQSRQKSYHDKRRKDLDFQAGDHVFFRVTHVTGVGRVLNSKKLTPQFIGLYQISDRVGNVAYKVVLSPNISNFHDVFHVSQLWKYVSDPPHVIHMDDVHVRDNLTVEPMPVRIEDRETKTLRGKDIALVKVVWSGTAGESMTWELESSMRESYPELFESDDNSRSFEQQISCIPSPLPFEPESESYEGPWLEI
ncbi:uncharacterized protein LOC131597986 [Vicia villosa]|uniref:uncharacterized protein LOC131597986 n=1 Tax=Vicia villosa TaxID=3911 RepID=UPI00273ABB88|nr:uncharacterized protein LOC131597986 [Vicia villosa]